MKIEFIQDEATQTVKVNEENYGELIFDTDQIKYEFEHADN
ncbi:hypothetical protein [Lactobacillus johnsonii]|nr:hypothetical protein [Lactobacillus johnsonii]